MLAALMLLPAQLQAQRRLSADVEVKNVSGGRVVTTHKHVCCLSSGRLVSHFTSPREFYSVETPNGEGRIYMPDTNEVFTDRSGSMSSQDNLMFIFLTHSTSDMGLSQLGYSLRSSETDDDGNLIKTFRTDRSGKDPTVKLVLRNFLPIYVEHSGADGRVRGRQYLSDYVTSGRLSFPTRHTEIIYPDGRDSIVIRTVYSGVASDSDDALAGFAIPASARPVSADRSRQAGLR